MTGYFITGTDTGVGKTCVSLALMRAFKLQDNKVAGMKPVSAGCIRTDKGLRNDDAIQLQNESSIEIPYSSVNPYSYEPPIAPHIAAQEAGEKIELDTITACYNEIAKQSDIVIVEGAGGWLVPISGTETMADVAVRLQLPVILVVGMQLGCLNHALLSVASIKTSRIILAGWVANHVAEHMEKSQANIDSLRHRIPAPLLGIVSHNTNDNLDQAAACLDIGTLIN